jgi:hypothetical protein
MKSFAAILHILYGTCGFYRAMRERQLDLYGYCAYAFTAAPYVVMSLLNLVATFCRPEYPRVFLVLYGGQSPPEMQRVVYRRQQDVAGEIGVVYGPSEYVEEPIFHAAGVNMQVYSPLPPSHTTNVKEGSALTLPL